MAERLDALEAELKEELLLELDGMLILLELNELDDDSPPLDSDIAELIARLELV